MSDRCSTLPGMSWKRGTSAVVAVCALTLAGTAGCAAGDGRVRGGAGASPTLVGKLLRGTDKEGRHYREVPAEGAPEVGVEVQPGADGAWDVRLTLRHFRFSPSGTASRAVPGRGFAFLFVDDRLVTRLRGLAHRIPARLVPRGTHHVTARLYADDGTAWAVAGEPVQSTADITASDPDPDAPATPGTPPDASGTPGAPPDLDASGTPGTRPDPDAFETPDPDAPGSPEARSAPDPRLLPRPAPDPAPDPYTASGAHPPTSARRGAGAPGAVVALGAEFAPGTPNVPSALNGRGVDPRTGGRGSSVPAGKAS